MSWPCIPKGVLAVFVLLYRCQSLHLSDTPAWQNVYSFLSHTTCRCSDATSLVGDMCSHLGTFFCFHGVILEHSLSKLLVSEVKRTICSRMAHWKVQILSLSLSTAILYFYQLVKWLHHHYLSQSWLDLGSPVNLLRNRLFNRLLDKIQIMLSLLHLLRLQDPWCWKAG